MDHLTGKERPDRIEVSQTVADLRAELAKRDLPRHLALFYRSTADQLEAVAAYLDHGLGTGHRCLYLADANARREIEDALRSVGIDVDARTEAGDLAIREASEVYLDEGFDPDRMIGVLEEEAEASVSDGYAGLWLAGENTWCFHTEMSFDRILEFESEFDATCPDLPVTALCQYDLTKFGEESAAKALWTHEQVIYRHTVCENPFYIPPGEYKSAAEPYLNAQLMLEQAYNLTRAYREVDRREQRLAVLNRVLRHNIRNDLNLVQGVLQHIGDTEDLAPDNEERLEAALDHAEAVLDISEKARHVQRTIGDPTVERVDLHSIVERAVNDVRERHPEAEISVSGDRDLAVLADTNLDIALSEALTNAIVHQEEDPPSVSLVVSAPESDTARIEVRNPGSIPESESRSVQQGQETQLEHGDGLGLWLVAWIVENAHGTVEFPETEDDRADIRIELYRIRD